MQKNSIIAALGPEDIEMRLYRDIYRGKFDSMLAPKKVPECMDSVSVIHKELFLRKYVSKGTKVAVWEGPEKRHLYGRDSSIDSVVYVDYVNENPFAEFRFVEDRTGKDVIRKDLEKFYTEMGFDVREYELPDEEFSVLKNSMTKNPQYCTICYTVENDSREARMLEEVSELRKHFSEKSLNI